jgi:hypothetical protein
MRKKIAWTYRCPICKTKAFLRGKPRNGELICRCNNDLCGHVMAFHVHDEKTGELVENPRQCPVCKSHHNNTETHKIYRPYSITTYRKFMQCLNGSCYHKSVMLVTFARTISPSAFGTFDVESGTVNLIKPVEYHVANDTDLNGIEDEDDSGSGIPSAVAARSSGEGGAGGLGHGLSRSNQQSIRFRWVDCPAT